MRLAYSVVLFALSLSAASNFTPQAYAGAHTAGVIPNAQTCMIPPNRPGESAVQALQRIGSSAFAAQANWGAGQPPTITYSLVYFRLEPKMQEFLSLHECGHLVLRTTNEFRANCYAMAHGAWTETDLDMIGRRHEALGPLPPQYGGSGHAFWVGTKRTCPQYFGQREN